ncbi:MAG TPA: AMP-binding protein [Casimicrobiaceae bacterium]|jgi:non-ribosomal peptide synthetase component E (peptide arylation enzyme)|nr:AMP-binding protein [Casimicrobiaceae bacterium]
MRTIFGAKLRQHALDAQASPAMAMPGREITYAELVGCVENCAAWLTCEGCLPSEVVGITIADEYIHMVASLALLCLGIPQVCLPTHDPASMRLHLAQTLAVNRVIVTDLQHALAGRKALLLTSETLGAAANAEPPDAAAANPDAFLRRSSECSKSIRPSELLPHLPNHRLLTVTYPLPRLNCTIRRRSALKS